MTPPMPKEAKRVLLMEPDKSETHIHVRNKNQGFFNIINFFTVFSVPGCPCYDLHWIWIPNDLPQEIRTVGCIPQSYLLCSCH